MIQFDDDGTGAGLHENYLRKVVIALISVLLLMALVFLMGRWSKRVEPEIVFKDAEVDFRAQDSLINLIDSYSSTVDNLNWELDQAYMQIEELKRIANNGRTAAKKVITAKPRRGNDLARRIDTLAAWFYADTTLSQYHVH